MLKVKERSKRRGRWLEIGLVPINESVLTPICSNKLEKSITQSFALIGSSLGCRSIERDATSVPLSVHDNDSMTRLDADLKASCRVDEKAGRRSLVRQLPTASTSKRRLMMFEYETCVAASITHSYILGRNSSFAKSNLTSLTCSLVLS